MKKIITIAAMFTSFAVINKTEAQIGYDDGANTAAPDARASANYNNNNTDNYNNANYNTGNYNTDDYYYLPDIDAYYNIPLQQYVYLDAGRWITAPYLPTVYRGFNLYAANKFRVHEARPYLRADFYRNRYASYRGNYRPAPVVVNRGAYAYNNAYGRDYGHTAIYRGGYGHEGGYNGYRGNVGHFDNGRGHGGNFGGHEEHGGGRGRR